MTHVNATHMGEASMAGLVSLSGWRVVRVRGGPVAVLAVAASLGCGVPAVASGPVGEPPVVDVRVSGPVSGVPERPRVVSESELAGSFTPPPVVWPAASVSDVDVPASSSDRVRAGVSPVWVGSPDGTGVGVAVSRFRVEVLGQRAADAVNVRGVLLRVGRVDG